MKKVQATFTCEVIKRSKLEIYRHFGIPKDEVSLDRVYLNSTFKEGDHVRVTVQRIGRGH